MKPKTSRKRSHLRFCRWMMLHNLVSDKPLEEDLREEDITETVMWAVEKGYIAGGVITRQGKVAYEKKLLD